MPAATLVVKSVNVAVDPSLTAVELARRLYVGRTGVREVSLMVTLAATLPKSPPGPVLNNVLKVNVSVSGPSVTLSAAIGIKTFARP